MFGGMTPKLFKSNGCPSNAGNGRSRLTSLLGQNDTDGPHAVSLLDRLFAAPTENSPVLARN